MIIRALKSSDIEMIFQFICELEKTTFDFVVFEKLFLKNISSLNSLYLLAELDGQIVGYLSCHAQTLLHHCGIVGEIQELFVSADYRNKSIGKALIKEVEQYAKANNWINLEVTCNKKRTDTHRFYRRLGYTNTHLKFVKEFK